MLYGLVQELSRPGGPACARESHSEHGACSSSVEFTLSLAAQIQGALKTACQEHANSHEGQYKAVAILIEGGPVSMVEARRAFSVSYERV